MLKKVTVGTGSANLTLAWNPRFMASVNKVLGSGGKLQAYVDMLVLETMEPYLPLDTSMLIKSGHLHSQIGKGKLIWRTPYARYLYHGMLMVDPVYRVGAFHNPKTGRFWSRKGVQKTVSDRPLVYKGSGKRGPKWAERWKPDNVVRVQKLVQIEAGKLLHR